MVEPFVNIREDLRIVTVAGLAAVLTGGVVFAMLAWRYGSDMGWDGSGSSLRSGSGPLVLIGAALAVIALGAITLLALRRQVSPESRLALGVMAAFAAAGIPLTLLAYPSVEPAVLTSVQPAGWHARLPVTEVLGVRSRSGGQLVIEGKLDRRHCAFELRAVTVDLATGDVTDVRALPSTYADISLVPPPPGPLDPEEFSVRQGSSPFICSG